MTTTTTYTDHAHACRENTRCTDCQKRVCGRCSRRVWVKTDRAERRLCIADLKKRGLSLVPRYYGGGE